MEGEMKHFSHDHPLILKAEDPQTIAPCDGCATPISAPFYSCGECGYYLHKECAELPDEINHPMHPQHPLTLRPNSNGHNCCNRCRKWVKQFFYRCSICDFDLDMICASKSEYKERTKGMERELQHFSHEHLLILKPEEPKMDGADPSSLVISCDMCSEPISGPFYSCVQCRYCLHSLCAELPNEMNHPMHPQHLLTLLSNPPYGEDFLCNICRMTCSEFFYSCSSCGFNVDMICALVSHTIKDKCHEHPLSPLQRLSSFLCDICMVEKKGSSYKCNICPFWVHQTCITLIPSTVIHNDHDHPLSLFSLVPPENRYFNKDMTCDICHDKILIFNCLYYCEQCWFISHASCALWPRLVYITIFVI